MITLCGDDHAPPATDWIFSYRVSNPVVSWPQFLEDTRRRFDPHYFVNYIELIAKLTQTGSLVDYNREFERMSTQIHGVSEATLLSMYLGGLRHLIWNQVRFQHPTSVAAAMALAMEFDTAVDRGNPSSRRPWQSRENRPSSTPASAPSLTELPQPGHTPSTSAKPRDYS